MKEGFYLFNNLKKYINKPNLYEASTNKFWDDEHISLGMLKSHLNPDNNAATRNHRFVRKSVSWITEQVPPSEYRKLLDLGCGPGIYGELFTNQGYSVTGIDLSKRSIDYAVNEAKTKNLNINYINGSYLEMDYSGEFDVATLIWCDYGALNDKDRETLLKKIYSALKPNGILIFDVFTDRNFEVLTENTNFEFIPDAGFWSDKEHICLNSSYKYEPSIELRQSIVITEDNVECYNIWERSFSKSDIKKELANADFEIVDLFDSINGEKYTNNSDTMCIIARK